MQLIGEDLHVLNQTFLDAVEQRDEEQIVKMAIEQADGGATALDINLGQNQKLGRLTPWLVETIQGRIDIPLFLSSHVLSQQRALEVHQGTATINAVTANPAELSRAMETAHYFKANLVVLLVSSDLTPTDENGRLQLASVVLEMAGKQGFPLEQLYLDPVVSCRQDPASWALSAGLPDINLILESIKLLCELGGSSLNTIVALSNASLCLASEKRSAFHCQLLPLLADAGLSAVILNCRDQQLMTVARELQMTKAA